MGNPGEGTTASTEQMAQFATRAGEAADSLTTMLSQMLNQLSPLDGWIGQGGTSFQTTKTTVQGETTRLNTALSGLSSDVSVASVEYVTSDEQQGSEMSTVNSGATGITSSLIL